MSYMDTPRFDAAAAVVRPGDALVIRIDRVLSPEQIEQARREYEAALGVRVLVLDCRARVEAVVRSGEGDGT